MAIATDTLLAIDGHVDVAIAGDDYSFPLADAIAGGLSAAVVPARVGLIPRHADPASGLKSLEATFAAIERTVVESAGGASIARSPQDVARNAAEGTFSFILGYQNARPLADLDALDSWLTRGISVFDFGFIGSNQWAESSRPYPYASVGVDFDGISPRAIEAIELLNDRGVIIDTAQVSPRARERILEISSAPVIASHNGLKAKVGEADRTIGDDEIRRIADAGGLVQIVAFDGYHTRRGDDPRVVADIRDLRVRFGLPGEAGPTAYYALLDAETAEWDEQKFTDYFREYHSSVRQGWPKTDIEQLVDSIDHVVRLVGADHVGIASDFHHGGGVQGWTDFTQTPNLTQALRHRFDEQDVAKIWGGNFLRVWTAARG